MSSATPELTTILTRAGAGAGKTTRLVKEVVHSFEALKRSGIRQPRMVVTTFTRKATQELKERLLKKALEMGDSEFLSFVLSRSDLHISTIHGTLNLFLRRHGDRMGLDPAFRLTDGSESVRWTLNYLREKAQSREVSPLLTKLGYRELGNRLLQLHRLQLSYPDAEPLKVESLIKEREAFHQDVRMRIQELLGAIRGEHKSWSKYFEDLKQISKFDLSKVQDWARFCEAVDDMSTPRTQPSPKSESEETHVKAKELRDLLKRVESPFYRPGIAEEYYGNTQLLQKQSREFGSWLLQQKLSRGLLQFDDLELLSLELLRRHPECGHQFAETWNYWLIDEYQDTSPIQVQLIHQLMGHSPHFIVGDPQQSIYFFRGARSQVFEQKANEVSSGKGKIETLNKNYRSDPQLMRFLNSITEPLGFSPMETKEDNSPNALGPVASVGKALDAESELAFLAHHISGLLAKGVPAEKLCVLARKNDTLKLIGSHLEKLGIPTQIHAAGGFFDRREILDLLFILKFLINPFDDLNLLSLLRSPWFRVQDSLLAEWRREGGCLWRRIAAEENEVLGRLRSAQALLSEKGILATFEWLVIESGMVEWSHEHDVTGQREANLWKFILDLHREASAPGFQPLSFIARTEKKFDLESDASEAEATPAFEPNRVNLMTVHLSKGLEFEYVFLPFCHAAFVARDRADLHFDEVEGKWMIPMLFDGEEKRYWPPQVERVRERLSEELKKEYDRVFYVAVTRAKQKIFLSIGGEIKESSWAGRWGLNWDEGDHKNPNYVYQVETGPWSTTPFRSAEQAVVQVLPPVFKDKDGPRQKRVTVTGLLAQESKGGPKPDPLLALQRAQRGVAVHKAFEAIHYQGLQRANAILPKMLGDVETSEELLQFLKARHSIPLLDLIANGETEYGFLVQMDQQVLEGQIDLWGKVGDHVYVVDYKTGDLRHSSKAFEQLRIYAFALSRLGHGAQYQLAAVYPFENQIIVEDFTVSMTQPP